MLLKQGILTDGLLTNVFFQIVDLIVTILEPSMEFVIKSVASVNAMMVFMVNYVIKVKAVQSLL